jgi:hypothetical protein
LPHATRVFTAQLRFVGVVLITAVLSVGFTDAAPSPALAPPAASGAKPSVTSAVTVSTSDLSSFDVAAWTTSSTAGLDPAVLKLALSASRCATSNGAVDDPATLSIIDYSRPSSEPRLWVFDLSTRTLLYHELVAHGQGSGGNRATQFSNAPDSHQTSLGLFVTDAPYVGRNGYSLRLDGLDKGFNDRARERAIVMHGAPYVNEGISKSLGRLGRSHGCPAVRDEVARELIDRVKGGSLLFAYYPDQEWLSSSKYLSSCGS